MIRFALKCADDHAFESWFQSDAAYETLQKSGHVTCPICGGGEVTKAIMAPRVRTARGAAKPETDAPKETALAAPADPKAAALAEIKAKIEANSDYVGMNFASEARAIHDGSAPERSIYGEAKPADAKALIEDGVPVAPLPFIPTRKAN